MPKKFLWFLQNGENEKFYTVQNGVVKEVGQPTPLQISPDGYKDALVNYSRSLQYSGIIRTIGIPLRFVFDSAKILRHVLYSKGPESVVYLIVLRFNPSTGVHESFYKAQIDLDTVDDQTDYIEFEVGPYGMSKKIKAKENTSYEIDLEQFGKKVRFDGIRFLKKYIYSTYVGSTTRGSHSVPIVFGYDEGTSFGMLPGSSYLRDNAGFNPATDDRWILNCIDQVIEVNLKGELKVVVENVGQNIQWFFERTNRLTIPIAPNRFYAAGSHTIPIDLTITLQPNEKIWFMCQKTEGIGSNRSIRYEVSEVNCTFKTRFKETDCYAVDPLTLGKQLLRNMLDDQDFEGFFSPVLGNSTLMLLSGDSVRGIPGSKIKTSWKSFVKSMDVEHFVGVFEQSEKTYIKDKALFFDNTTEVFELGEVDAKFSFWEPAQINRISVGYRDQTYDDVNGKDEFNTTNVFQSPRTSIDKELSIVSEYRADMYGIELTRANLNGKTTTDSSSDNDTFVVDCFWDSVDNVYRPKRSSGTVQGLIDGSTAFNLSLSPANILRKHGPWIRSCCWPYESSKIKFLSSEKNPQLVVTESGITISERADLNVGDLLPKLFLPIVAEFETVVPTNLIQLMEENPHGFFTFTYLGTEYKGFVLEASQRVTDEAEQTWKLLLSPSTDITKLIR